MSEEEVKAVVAYGSYDLDDAAEDRAELDASGSGANFMTLTDGKNVVRFLPPLQGQKPFRKVKQHYVKRPSENQLVIPCPRAMLKRPCPICDRIKQLSGSRSKADQDLAKSYDVKLRVFANIIDRGDMEAGPKILGFGKMIFDELVRIREDVDGGGDFVDPVNGFDIIIEKSGTGMLTKYKVAAARSDSGLGNMEWIPMQNDLDRYAKVESEADIVDRINGGQGSSGRDEPKAELAAAPAAAATGRGRGRSVQDTIDVEEAAEAPADGISW